MNNMEQIIFEIISYGGTAKAIVYEAMAAAQNGKFDEAEELLKEADENLVHAHQIQTNLIQEEARGEHHPVTVLFVHAQDHLMEAMEVRSLADNIINLNRRLAVLETR